MELMLVDCFFLAAAVAFPICLFQLHLSMLIQGIDIWKDFEPDPGPWCEKPRMGEVLRERSNAGSDLAFIFVALYMLRCGVRDWLNASSCKVEVDRSQSKKDDEHTAISVTFPSFFQLHPSVSVLCGILNLAHGFGTMFNHACRCFAGHRADVMGMYAVVGFWGVCDLYRYSCLSSQLQAAAAVKSSGRLSSSSPHTFVVIKVAALLCVLLACVWPASKLKYDTHELTEATEAGLVAVLIAADLVLELMIRRVVGFAALPSHLSSFGRGVLLYLGAGAILFGAVAQKADIRKVGCVQSSLFQWHAVWHVAAALCLLCVFVHRRSERVKVQVSVPAAQK
mmetsp:Transcript_10733/g.20380  ORF Transcript_10733/g.20380 Transcript_10733/m.20380 type:complete len:338 (+) Transcript_10733:1-1014(+)